MTIGLCSCGCGEPAPVAQMTRTQLGHVRGQPIKYIQGHQGRRGPLWKIVDAGYRTPCRLWQQQITADGYGRVRIGGRKRLTHVIEWERIHGPVPPGLQLDHLCRNRACGEPTHLEPVTAALNVERGAAAKLTSEDVHMIRRSTSTSLALAQQLGVTKGAVSHVRTGRNWSSL